ncbi:TVP38/TMEM64 family protein [Streptococcus hongkongensis]|nr:membrane protein [Streptococcus uberis]
MNLEKRGVDHKRLIHVLTFVGIIISLLFFIYFKSHPNFFAIGGTFQEYLTKMGIFAPFIFLLLQIVQVIYPIIPGGLTCVLGHVAFGPFLGFIYNTLGIFLGSVISFLLARKYGKTFVKSFVSTEMYNKYIKYLDKGKFFERFLFLTFALPGFPDDFLCMVAGISKMKLNKFITIFLISNPVTLYIYTILTYHGIKLVGNLM